MNVKERYKFVETGREISFMPNYNFLRTLVWWLLLGVIALPVIFLFKHKMNGGFEAALLFWALYMGYFLFDLFFRVPVKYIFNKQDKTIYRKLFYNSKVVGFDDMTCFIIDDNNGYYYAIGKKRNQFVKNYRISNYFSNSKSSQKREDDYIEKILNPVFDLTGASL